MLLGGGKENSIEKDKDMAAKGEVRADIEPRPLSKVNKIFDSLVHGDVPSRVVLDFAAA